MIEPSDHGGGAYIDGAAAEALVECCALPAAVAAFGLLSVRLASRSPLTALEGTIDEYGDEPISLGRENGVLVHADRTRGQTPAGHHHGLLGSVVPKWSCLTDQTSYQTRSPEEDRPDH